MWRSAQWSVNVWCNFIFNIIKCQTKQAFRKASDSRLRSKIFEYTEAKSFPSLRQLRVRFPVKMHELIKWLSWMQRSLDKNIRLMHECKCKMSLNWLFKDTNVMFRMFSARLFSECCVQSQFCCDAGVAVPESPVKRYPCEFCGRTFTLSTEWERHVLRHGMWVPQSLSLT